MQVVLPIYDEEGSIRELWDRLDQVREVLADKVSFGVIAVENASRDSSMALLTEMAESFPYTVVLSLHRNSGMDGALMAGIRSSDADAVILMQADLEDPPEVIEEFVAAWLAGSDHVQGVHDGSHLRGSRKTLTWLFYRVTRFVAGTSLPANSSDYQLLDRNIYEPVARMNLRLIYLRMAPHRLARATTFVNYTRQIRVSGHSKYRVFRIIRFALTSLLLENPSQRALWFLLILPVSVVAMMSSVGLLLASLFIGVPYDGFGTQVALSSLWGVLTSGISLMTLLLLVRLIRSQQGFPDYRRSTPRPAVGAPSQNRPGAPCSDDDG